MSEAICFTSHIVPVSYTFSKLKLRPAENSSHGIKQQSMTHYKLVDGHFFEFFNDTTNKQKTPTMSVIYKNVVFVLSNYVLAVWFSTIWHKQYF